MIGPFYMNDSTGNLAMEAEQNSALTVTIFGIEPDVSWTDQSVERVQKLDRITLNMILYGYELIMNTSREKTWHQ